MISMGIAANDVFDGSVVKFVVARGIDEWQIVVWICIDDENAIVANRQGDPQRQAVYDQVNIVSQLLEFNGFFFSLGDFFAIDKQWSDKQRHH